MKIILPLANPKAAVKVLYTDHLEKMIGEIKRVLDLIDSGQAEDVYECMWEYDTEALIHYGFLLAVEHYTRTEQDKFVTKFIDLGLERPFTEWPLFTMDMVIVYSHQSYLVRQWGEEYKRVFPEMTSKLPLVWQGSPQKERQKIIDAMRVRNITFSDDVEEDDVNV